jgi:hypothetical protein
MIPVAQAKRQTAPKLVYLEVVTTALRKLGLSEESITCSIFRGFGDGSLPYYHTGEAPPPGFWRTNLDNVRFNASDISNLLIAPASAGVAGFYTFTLRDVMLPWEDAVVKYPALRDTEPPELGTSRVEVSFATSLMRWLEMLATRLWRKPSPAEEAPETPAPTVAKTRKAGPGAERTYDHAAFKAAAKTVLERGRPDTKALFYEKVRDELHARKVKAPPEDDDTTLRRVVGPLWDGES